MTQSALFQYSSRINALTQEDNMNQDAQSGLVSGLRFLSISNPMDWQAIDRFILLASLVLLAPSSFGIALWFANQHAPEYLNQTLVPYLLALYVAHIALLTSLIIKAISLRHKVSDWPMFENIIIGSYLFVVLLTSYLSGSHFTEGLLLIFLGVNITCTLADVNKIRLCFWFVVPVLVLMGVADFTPSIPYAILLEQSPVAPDGRPLIGWFGVRTMVVLTLAPLIYLCILAMKRWVERENLYQEMSMIDGLTRLSNRNSFINRGNVEIEQARKEEDISMPPLSCIMIDLDHFKLINDTWGHHAGDEVLIAASQVLLDSARKNDEVGRYGGEEFAMLLPKTNLLKAKLIAERLRRKISEMQVKIDGQTIKVTASFGVACYPSPGVEAMSDLLKTADKALYEAKETGRNKVVTS